MTGIGQMVVPGAPRDSLHILDTLLNLDAGARPEMVATDNALAAALKEYGALRRTIYAARYLSDPAYRRKIARQLNKGESLHALLTLTLKRSWPPTVGPRC